MMTKLSDLRELVGLAAQPSEAFRMFERWCADHDPDGEKDVLDAALAYSTWAETNDVSIYRDAQQQSASEG